MYTNESESVKLTRDCTAVAVPEGVTVTLPKGTSGSLTQALGGSFTIYVRGRMFRIEGQEADALGKKPPRPPELPEGASDEDVEKLVWEQMKGCFDPEIPINIVDLGLVYECNIVKNKGNLREVFIKMTLTTPSCGMGDVLAEDVKYRVEMVPTIAAVHVQLVFDPPWSRDRMSDFAKLKMGMY